MSIIARLFRRRRRPLPEFCPADERAARRARIEDLLREIAEPPGLARPGG